MCDEWEEVSVADADCDEWVVPDLDEIPEGFNPVPTPWCIFNSKINLSISFTILKGFSQTITSPLLPTEVVSLSSIYNESDVRTILRETNRIWEQASISFNLKQYKEIFSRSNPNMYSPSNWFNSFERIISPRTSWDLDAKVNVFIVPYLNEEILGTTASWGPMGVGRMSYIYLSETHPLTLDREQPSQIGRTLAHELGHHLGLEHNEIQPSSLMYPSDNGVTPTPTLSRDEITYTRAVASTLHTPREAGYGISSRSGSRASNLTTGPYENLRLT